MTSESLLDSLEEPSSLDDAARLLFVVCPDEVKENGFDSPESFACFLHRNRFLVNNVKAAYAAKDFSSIWESFLQKQSFHKTSASFNISSARLALVVNGGMDTPVWTLSNVCGTDAQNLVRSFSLESLLEEATVPSMLFYDLGSFMENPVHKERLQELFVIGQNTFLVNASATGKTRLLYEGLFQHWGIYVTARVDHSEARALDSALHAPFSDELELVEVLPEKTALGYQRLLDDNNECLNQRFSVVLLAHLYIFKEFLKTSHAEHVMDNDILPKLWFLCQVWRTWLDADDDLHNHIYRTLSRKPFALIVEELSSVVLEIKPLLPDIIKREGLFVAIDEANVASEPAWWDREEKHPPLKNLIRTWQRHLAALDCPITFVVAGTEIPMDAFPSASPEWSNWRWTSNTGSFDTPDVQRDYIIPFLPPSFPETPSGKAFIERVWNWCQPRHRLTASLIHLLIEDKFRHPHVMLDRYIKRLITYEATDGAAFSKMEGSSDTQPYFYAIDGVIASDQLAQSAAHEVIFHYIMTGGHPRHYGVDRINIVTRGVGQFKDGAMQVIAIDQPGITIAAAIWLGKDHEAGQSEQLRSLKLFSSFSKTFNLRWPNGDNYSSAGYIALYLAHVFVGGRKMADVFALPTPLWLGDASSIAHLVVLRKAGDTGKVQEKIVGPSDLLPNTPPLGYKASSTEEVVAWLRHEHVGAFCLCPPGFPADLIFTLKIHEKYVWVLLRATGQGMTLETKDLKSDFENLSQENLFPLTDANTCREDFVNAINALPNSLAPPATFPFLRVLASFPDEPKLPRGNLAQRLRGGPVAVLKLDTFKEVTESFSPADLVERLIASMHGKRSSYSDDDSFVSPEPTERRPRKKPATSKSNVKSGATQAKNPSHETRPTRSMHRSKTPSQTTRSAVSSSLSRQIAKEPVRAPASRRVKKDAETKASEPESSGLQLRQSPRKRHTT